MFRKMDLTQKIIFTLSGYFFLMIAVSPRLLKSRMMDMGFNSSTIIWFIIPFGFVVILLGALKCNKDLRINLILSVASILFFLVVLEFIITRPLYQKERENLMRLPAAQKLGIDFDDRPKSKVVWDYRIQRRINAYPAIYPNLVNNITIEGKEVAPLGGISNVTTVFCNESGQYIVYESDEYGFRNPKGLYHIPKLHIGIIGDSYIHGACVQSGETIADNIRKEYPGTISLATSVNGSLRNLASLKEYWGGAEA